MGDAEHEGVVEVVKLAVDHGATHAGEPGRKPDKAATKPWAGQAQAETAERGERGVRGRR